MSSRRRQALLGLFLFFLAFYLATASGHTVTIDGDYYYRAAESIVLRGSFAVEPVNQRDVGLFAMRAPDGQIYGKFAPLQSVAEAPFYLALRSLASGYLGEGPGLSTFLRVWVPVATTATVGAALVALVGHAAHSLGSSRRTAAAVAAIFGLATLAWPYGRSEFSEPLQALLLLGAFLYLRQVGAKGAWRPSLLSGLLLGLFVLTKAINLVVLPIFGLALLWRLRERPPREVVVGALAFGFAALVGVGGFTLLNQVRTGNPLDFGYSEPFDMPLLLGLYGWTFSPGKGVFLYMPVLLACVAAFRPFARRHPFESAVIGATSAVLVLLYASFWAWSGDWAWGVRFAVPLLPLWILPLVTGLAEWRSVGRAFIAATAAASLAVQILGVSVDPMKYLSYYHEHVSPLVGEPRGYTWAKESKTQVHFAPELSPLVGHWQMLRATLGGDPSLVSRDPPSALAEPSPAARALGFRHAPPPAFQPTLGLDLWIVRATSREAWLARVLLCLVAIGGLLLLARGDLPGSCQPCPNTDP